MLIVVKSIFVTSVSSNSVSVSGVGVRCSTIEVFDSDNSVSVGCSDSVSGVDALGFSYIKYRKI